MKDQLDAKPMVRSRALPKMVQRYLMWAAGLSLLYLTSPIVSYLIFWGILPKVSLTLFFGIALVPTLGWRILLLLTDQMRFRRKELTLSFLVLLWISLLQFLWYQTVSSQIGSGEVLSILALTFVGAWVLWLGGESLAYLMAQRQRLVRIAIFVVWVGLALVILEGVARGFKFYGLLLFAFQDPVSREIYNYLAVGDSLVITSLLFLGGVGDTSLYKQLRMYFITAVLLLFAYSRASFLLFLIVGLASICLRFRFRLKRQSLLALSGTGAVIVMIYLLQPNQVYDEDLLKIAYPLLERFSAPFTGTDLSLQQRVELLIRGIELLKEHWLLGHFLIEAIEIKKGAYIHNWLSFWLAYGIGPFLLSLWTILSLLVKSWRMRKRTPLGLSAFSLLTFGFLAIVAARSYVWPYVWLAMGFAGAALPCQQRGNSVL